MADNSNILQEFLVALGFKVDETGLKKFTGVLEGTTKTAVKGSAAISGLAAGVEKYVSTVAYQLEKLYYVSQRTGSTVGNIQALTYASERLGLTGDQIKGSLENMARALRTNPGLLGLLNSLGVKVVGRDKSDVLTDLVTQLNKLPFYQANAIAGLFGIDSDTLFMLERGLKDFKELQDRRKKLNAEAGLTEQDAKDAQEFANSLRDVNSEVEVLKLQIEKDLLPAAKILTGWLRETVDWFVKADVATNGWSNRIGVLVAGIGSLVAAKSAMGWLKGLLGGAGAAAGEGAAGGAAAGATAGGAAGLTLGGAAAVGGTGLLLGASVYALLRSIAAKQQAEADLKMQEYGAANDALIRKLHTGGNTNDDLPIGVRQNNPGNLRKWGNAPIAGGFARFKDAAEGLQAMAGNLLNYSRRGWDSITSIISHWAPKSENDTNSYIRDISQRMGVNANEHLNLGSSGTLQRLMAAMIHREQGMDPYSMQMIADAANYRLGGSPTMAGGVHFSQKTDIHVAGGANANDTARAVANEQGRVNGDVVRDLGGVVR